MTTNEISFDGKIRPYVADPANLYSNPDLRFYEGETEVDPILQEVVRHKLLQINDDHGATIERLSGSPITLYTNDFNSGILTGKGELLFMGPYVQWFAAMMDTAVRWIIENRSDNPGIKPGDMWLLNDPWVGTLHQQDVGVMAPVFNDDGELLCWTGNFAHHYDVGGSVPGSFVPNAKDVYDEGPPIPPVKVVEDGKIRQDIEDVFLRQSRRPDIVKLDLHAQIAGNESAIRKIDALRARYGDATVATVMNRILDTGEKAFLEKLKLIPDGQWSARVFLDGATEGDRGAYEIVSTVKKEGDQLEFFNEGSHPQVGILNSSFATWRGGVATVLNATIAADQLYAIGGAMRRVTFRPTPDTVTCASYPASMSCAGNIGGHVTVLAAHLAMGKMLAASEELRSYVLCQQAGSQWPLTAISGVDENGKAFGTGLMDGMVGGLGAFTFRDGVDTGGLYFIPRGRAGNVEENEDGYPILYLCRREKRGSGGAGKFRGGNSLEAMFIPHGVPDLVQTTATSGVGIPTGLGLFGGLPSTTNYFGLVRDSNVLDVMKAGRVPQSIEELGGSVEHLASKNPGYAQGSADVYVMHGTAGAGYGDPLTRDPGRVVVDVELGKVDASVVGDLYGVVLSESAALDPSATAERRESLLSDRLVRSTEPAISASGVECSEMVSIGGDVGLCEHDGTPHYGCRECKTVLGPTSASFPSYCRSEDVDVRGVNPHIRDPKDWVDADIALRCFYCPSCGTMLDNQIMVSGHEEWDNAYLDGAAALGEAVRA
jgi:N-methylhydantoinase B